MSSDLFKKALLRIPGGVNSPVRAFRGVGGNPVFVKAGEGAYLIGADGQRYIDYVCSWGALVLGHAHAEVVSAVQQAAAQGLSFGAPTEAETRMAERLCQLMPSMDLVRLVSSGTEAAMSAIRLARGVTGRDKIVKFEGGYHGHADALLVKAGSGLLTMGVPSSAGIPAAVAEHTLSLTYNDIESVRAAFTAMGEQIACIIVEPVAGNMNCIAPRPHFLHQLRALCDDYGSLLIFDEVISGFRVALGGAQVLYGVRPDLTILGKIIGGGLPMGAFGGKREIMEHLAPLGPVYQAGTLSGNPVAVAAGLATLAIITKPGFYETLTATAAQLTQGLVECAQHAGVAMTAHSVGGLFGIFFTDAPVVDTYAEVLRCDMHRFRNFFHAMLAQGIYLAPSPFEAGFVSAAHGAAEIDATLAAARRALV